MEENVKNQKRYYNKKKLKREELQMHKIFIVVLECINFLLNFKNDNQRRVRSLALRTLFSIFPSATFPSPSKNILFTVMFGYTKDGYVNMGPERNIIKIITLTVYSSGTIRYKIECPTLPTWKDFNNTKLYAANERNKAVYRLRDKLIKDGLYFNYKMFNYVCKNAFKITIP